MRPAPFHLKRPRRGVIRRATSALVNPAIERVLSLNKLNDVYHNVCRFDDDRHFVDKALAALDVTINVTDDELARIPKTGPLIIVANHPFGAIDGMILMSILRRARPLDGKVMANFMLHRIRELRHMLIAVDPFGGSDAKSRNLGPMKASLRHLESGGALAIFPAGEVAHLELSQRAIVDPPWTEMIGRIARRTGAPVLPLYFHGRNGPLFNLLGLIHPRLRTVMLPRELLKKKHATLTVRIGHPIPAPRLAALPNDRRVTDYLRMRTFLLAAGLHVRDTQSAPPPTLLNPEPIAEAIDPRKLATQIASLPPECKLVEAGDQTVYACYARQAPLVLRELGRLREIAFRAVGEGTGRCLDIDRFDDDYLHLFIWHPQKEMIVGAYRLGLTDKIVAQRGISGLYTTTLFDYNENLINQISPAIELGRSFIRPEFQRSHTALMNLWKGIGRFTMLNPQYARLLGPVSISNDYHDISRRLMVDFLTANNMAPDLAALCKPRHPLLAPPRGHIRAQLDSIVVQDIDEVSDIIADIERQPKGIPILLRQYLRLGARMLGFNIDPDFGSVLDGLIYVDMRRTDPRILAKYMGKEESRQFLAHHGVHV